MEDGNRQTEALDRAIDLAVRSMMDVEPRADLRARVIERIERPHRWLMWTWVVAPLAAAAVLVVAVMLRQPTGRQAPRPASDIVLSAPAASGRTAPPDAHTSNRIVRRGSQGAARTNALSRRVVAASMAEEPARPIIEIEPLQQIDAISVAPVTLRLVSAQQIAIAPLGPIAQIELEPVNPSGGRN
jgi:hypothetical protein